MQTRRPRWALILGVVAVTGLALAQGNGGPPARGDVDKRMREGNWNEAYKGFSALALFPDSDPKEVGNDLTKAVQCLRNLGRVSESDAVRSIYRYKPEGRAEPSKRTR